MKNQKTVIFVTASINLSGADLSLYSLIKKFKSEQYDVKVIISGDGKTSNFLKANDIEYFVVPFKCWRTSKNQLIRLLMVRVRNFFYNRYLLFRHYKKIITNCNDICCVYNNGFTNDFAVLLAKKIKKPCVYHIREFGDLDFHWNFLKGNKFRQYEAVEKDVDLFIAISNAVKESFSKARNYERIKVVYNGIENKDINDKSKNCDDKVIRIVISGRLGEEKGHILLLKAIKNIIDKGITNLHLDIYGDGEEKDNINNFIKNNHLDNYVTLKGFVLGIDYQQYDIGIMASRAEAFGRVTVEYMMNGLVTIASNSGANPELICDYEDGILFNCNDEKDLTNKMLEVLNSSELRDKISKNAIKSAREKYSEEAYVNNVYHLLVEENILEK